MAKSTSELVVRVRVEVDYEKLAEAIRKGQRESVIITTTPERRAVADAEVRA